jgi:hypothetical protein
MGRLERRLDKLEQEIGCSQETLRLPDGTTLLYQPEAAAAALSATIAGEGHALIQPFVSAEQTTGVPGLVRSLVLSRKLIEERER